MMLCQLMVDGATECRGQYEVVDDVMSAPPSQVVPLGKDAVMVQLTGEHHGHDCGGDHGFLVTVRAFLCDLV